MGAARIRAFGRDGETSETGSVAHHEAEGMAHRMHHVVNQWHRSKQQKVQGHRNPDKGPENGQCRPQGNPGPMDGPNFGTLFKTCITHSGSLSLTDYSENSIHVNVAWY